MEVWIRQGMAYHPETDGPMPFPVPGWMWDRELGEQLYADRIRYMRRVDKLGFDGLIFTEHHYGPNGGLTPSPLIMLSAASQVTERIKLVTMGIALALYPHPVRVAEELAMVDNLSRGRLTVGFISSGAQSLYSYSVPVAEERGRYHEAYDLVVKAWQEENPFAWHGEHFDYECISILPRPLQQPHPPVWTTAVAAESIQWAAEHRIAMLASGTVENSRDILNYYQEYAETECDWSPTPAQRGIHREFFLAPTKAAAQKQIDTLMNRESADQYARVFEAPVLQDLERERYKVRSFDYAHSGGRPARSGRNLDGLRGGSYLVGDPDSMTEQILEQRAACNADVLVIRPEIGRMTLEQVGDSLELFAREVLPVLHRA
jgi:alkanesulfonate monooxygenase SsuD/methylene tetrahydromethanopterin reductase-like flavin-dependent oxidoreductase (luciferase family)